MKRRNLPIKHLIATMTLIGISLIFLTIAVVGLLTQNKDEILNTITNDNQYLNQQLKIDSIFDVVYFANNYSSIAIIDSLYGLHFFTFLLVIWHYILPFFGIFALILLVMLLWRIYVQKLNMRKYILYRHVGKIMSYVSLGLVVGFLIIALICAYSLESKFSIYEQIWSGQPNYKGFNFYNWINPNIINYFDIAALMSNQSYIGIIFGQHITAISSTNEQFTNLINDNIYLISFICMVLYVFTPIFGIMLIVTFSLWWSTQISNQNGGRLSKFTNWLNHKRINTVKEYKGMFSKTSKWFWISFIFFAIAIAIPGIIQLYKINYAWVIAAFSVLLFFLVFTPLIVGYIRTKKIHTVRYNLLLFTQLVIMNTFAIIIQTIYFTFFKFVFISPSVLMILVPILTITLCSLSIFLFIKENDS